MFYHIIEDIADASCVAVGPAWTEPGFPPGRGIATGIDHLTNESDGVRDTGTCLLNGMSEIDQVYRCAVP